MRFLIRREELKTEASEGQEIKDDSVEKEIGIGIVSSQYQMFRACHFAEQALKQREEGKRMLYRKSALWAFLR